MPYTKSKRPYAHEYQLQKARGELPARMDRQRARRKLDAEGVDRGNKVIDHIKPLSKGGSNAKSNLRLESRSKNASFSRNSDSSIKRNVPKKKR